MKKFYYILGSLQAFTAIGAIPAGYGLLMDTTGQGVGMSTKLLENSPLNSFLLPGLFLLLVNGLAHLAGAWLSFTRHRYAGYTGLILGVLLSLWIIIQVAWISLSSVLQPLFLLIGLINTYLGWRIVKTRQSNSY
ncbi:MAG: hypothetical protein RBR81_06190 [Bacteroidales bacterium]|jgi:hypothetical protein|nr:hypothetical protein [Bacteroidales bacterium]